MPKTKLPAEGRDDLPRVSVTLTDETAWLTRYDPRGKPATTYPVSLTDVARVLRSAGARTSGLLPEGILFQTEIAGQARLGLWLPPARRTILIGAGNGARQLPVWLPGLVLIGQARTWWVFAAHERPASEQARLYRAPLPNVYGDGKVCQGSAGFPLAAPGTLAQAVAAFLESEFNGDLGDSKIAGWQGTTVEFLRGLRGKFPAGRLVDAGRTLGEMMGGPRRAGQDEDRDTEDAVTDPFGVL